MIREIHVARAVAAAMLAWSTAAAGDKIPSAHPAATAAAQEDALPEICTVPDDSDAVMAKIGVPPFRFDSKWWKQSPPAVAARYLRANLPKGNESSNGPPGPPASSQPAAVPGWLVVDENFQGCYGSEGTLLALRHGIDEPFLLKIHDVSTLREGARTLQLYSYTARLAVVRLSRAEADFISGVTVWLDRANAGLTEEDYRMPSSTGERFATLDLINPATPTRLESFVWDSSTASFGINATYNEETKLNLIRRFLTKAVRDKLGDRWDGESPANREERVQMIQGMLNQDEASAWPLSVIRHLIVLAGSEGLHEILPHLRLLRENLAAPSPAETELAELNRQIRLAPPLPEDPDAIFGPPDSPKESPEQAAARARSERAAKLEGNLDFDRGAQLRADLESAIRQLEASQSTPALLELALGDGDSARWAERQLQKRAPAEFARVLIHNLGRYPQARMETVDELVQFNPGDDPDLPATVWHDLLKGHSSIFSATSPGANRLRARCAEVIAGTSAATRKKILGEIAGIDLQDPELQTWVKGLGR